MVLGLAKTRFVDAMPHSLTLLDEGKALVGEAGSQLVLEVSKGSGELDVAET